MVDASYKKTDFAKIYRFPMILQEHIRIFALYIILSLILAACGTFNPKPYNDSDFLKRIQTQAEKDIRISAAVLSAEETEAVFNLPLYKKDIQPVWLEIENNTPYRMWFVPISVDRNYLSALEVAYMHHFAFSKSANRKMDQFFHQHAFTNPIEPGDVRSGFIFTNLDMGTKAFNAEVIGGNGQVRAFTFLIPVPGLDVDYRDVDWDSLYSSDDLIPFDTPQAFRKALEELPCCTTGSVGGKMADPVNVVIIGEGRDILYALRRSGWDETASSSSFDRKKQFSWEFKYQPVKPLYLFDRSQDAAFRKFRSTLNERLQLRLWLSPFFFDGKNVWIGQISRIFRKSAWNKFRIEPDVDESRTYLFQDLLYAQVILKYGYVKGTGIATISKPRKSLQDDAYFTDGLRLVIWVSNEPVSLSDIQFMPWEKPIAERRKLLLGN